MLDKQEVHSEIEALENKENHSAAVIARLASLYTIRDHLDAGDQTYDLSYSRAASSEQTQIGLYGGSDFLQALAGKDSATAWAVMDELMDTLKVVNIRVYNSVLRKIRQI